MNYTMKEIKGLIADLKESTGQDVELIKTNRSNYMVLRIGNAQYLTSYRSLVAMSVGGNTMINSNYTGKNKRGGVTACSVTTGKHFKEFAGYGWNNAVLVDFNDVTDLPNLKDMARRFNTRGSF